MKLRFLKDENGSDDGITLKRFKKDGTYIVPSDLGLELATVFIVNRIAKIVEEEVIAEVKTIEDVELPSDTDFEIIDLEDDDDYLTEEVVKEVEEVRKFTKHSDVKKKVEKAKPKKKK